MATKLGAYETTGAVEFTVEGKHNAMPFTLSIEGPDDTLFTVIPKGAKLPQKFSQVYTNAGSFEMATFLHLVMGERNFASANKRLCVARFDQGSFRSSGKARYQLDVEVTQKCKLLVRASNLDSKAPSKIYYDASIISVDDIEAMKNEAKAAAEHDKEMQERFNFMAEVRSAVNNLSSELYPTAKKKMTFAEKNAFKKCRNRVYKLIQPGPGGISEEGLQELKDIQEVQLPKQLALLEERVKQVEAWYK